MNLNALARVHFETAAGAGRLEGPDIVRGAAGSLAGGTWIQFDLRVHRDAAGVPRIAEAKFLAFGCPHTIAAGDWLVSQAQGMQLQPQLPLPVDALQQQLDVPVEKLGRLLTVEDAWLAATRAALAMPGVSPA